MRTANEAIGGRSAAPLPVSHVDDDHATAGAWLFAADLDGCELLTQHSLEEITEQFARLLQAAGATIVRRVAHVYPGAGLTSVLILAESHAILHTWPEYGTVNVDIFSCSSRLQSRRVIDALAQFLGARSIVLREVPRGDHRPAGFVAPG